MSIISAKTKKYGEFVFDGDVVELRGGYADKEFMYSLYSGLPSGWSVFSSGNAMSMTTRCK